MNDQTENHVTPHPPKNIVFPPVTVGASPKWFTQHGPVI